MRVFRAQAHYCRVERTTGIPRGAETSEPCAEPLGEHLDQLENVLTAQDTELRRIRTELELRNLYVAELHAVLRRQAGQLEELAARVRQLEEQRRGKPS